MHLHKTMKKYLLLICILFSSSLLAADSWPVGKWNMLDDFTELPEAIIQISATKAGGFEGKIIEVFPDPEDDPVDVCKPCAGLDKNKPIIGLVVFKQLKLNAKKELVGKVLDPDSGKIYKCKLKPLTNNRIELNVIVNRLISQDRYLSLAK
ncbi:MAG: DUF2147 domain-containing protein [Candidatus Methylopumilus sp.]|nr:DUF2147 domain-containing protein [Candidatus Methylopumilus sp.]